MCSLIPSEPARIRSIHGLVEGEVAGVPTRELRDDPNAAGFRSSRGQRLTLQTLLPTPDHAAGLGGCVDAKRTLSKWHRCSAGSSVERQDEGVDRRAAGDWIACEGAGPAIVDPATIERVRRGRRPSKAEGGVHCRGNAMNSACLRTGRIFCGVCGGKLTGTTCTSGKGHTTRDYVCSPHHAGYRDECPKRHTVPADFVEAHELELVRADLLRLRDDDMLHGCVEDEVRRLHGSQRDARKQLQRLVADLGQALANLREHLAALAPKTAEGLGLYAKARELSDERRHLEAELAGTSGGPELPPVGDLRQRIAHEFGRLEEVMASGLLEARRQLVAGYVHAIKADPGKQAVEIGLVPTRFGEGSHPLE